MEDTPPISKCQKELSDVSLEFLGRPNDLLTCLKYTIKKSGKASEVIFKMDVMDNDRESTKTISLKGTCTPGDDLEPVIKVMFPDED